MMMTRRTTDLQHQRLVTLDLHRVHPSSLSCTTCVVLQFIWHRSGGPRSATRPKAVADREGRDRQQPSTNQTTSPRHRVTNKLRCNCTSMLTFNFDAVPVCKHICPEPTWIFHWGPIYSRSTAEQTSRAGSTYNLLERVTTHQAFTLEHMGIRLT